MHRPLVATILHATVDQPEQLAAWELSSDVLQVWLADNSASPSDVVEYLEVCLPVSSGSVW